MRRHYLFEKEVGETPLQALDRLRQVHTIAKTIPLAYAGRLDPMASGKLLVLAGDECKQQEKYHALDKEYVFEVLCGVATDTGDVLGVVEENTESENKQLLSDEQLIVVSKKFIGVQQFPYPHYSSKTVQGKPLFLWTLEGRLNEIDIPKVTSTIYTLKYISQRILSKETLHQTIVDKIALLPKVEEVSKELGRDFRREEVLEAWRVFFKKTRQANFTIAQFQCACSSGTYIRSLAPALAQALDIPGIAFSIQRTRIGKYRRFLGFWW